MEFCTIVGLIVLLLVVAVGVSLAFAAAFGGTECTNSEYLLAGTWLFILVAAVAISLFIVDLNVHPEKLGWQKISEESSISDNEIEEVSDNEINN